MEAGALNQKPKAQISKTRWGAGLENEGREKGENSGNMTNKGHEKEKMAKMPPHDHVVTPSASSFDSAPTGRNCP